MEDLPILDGQPGVVIDGLRSAVDSLFGASPAQ